MRKKMLVLCSLGLSLFSSFGYGATLLQENFDNSNFSSRGWYDGSNPVGGIDSVEHIPNSSSSLKFHYLVGGTKPNPAHGNYIWRHTFTPTSQIYLSYWIKHSANWVGSGRPYHPHIFYFLTNQNDTWVGPAFTHLTAYVEENQGYPQLAIQDGQNINRSYPIHTNLISTTENRSVAGCNGIQSVGQSGNDCYPNGSDYWNGIAWKGGTAHFANPSTKTQWHFMETYIQLNTIVAGVSQKNGIVRHWYDGTLVIDRSDVVLRTAQYPSMQFNQFMIGPWIGDGSPVEQTFWIDDLTIGTERPASVPASAKKPMMPTQLKAR